MTKHAIILPVTLKEYKHQHRLKNLSRYKELRKIHYYTHRRESIQKTLAWQQKNIKERRLYWKTYRQNWRKNKSNKFKEKARTAVMLAIRKGILKKHPCEKCGAIKNVHAHHPSYFKPLNVIWLCRFHHDLLHNPLTQKELNSE